MKSYVLLALLLVIGSSAFTQVNYVLNPGFEAYSYCPRTFDQIRAANFWYGLDTIDINQNPGMPDYLNACANGTNFQVSIPHNAYGYQHPISGSGISQIVAFFDESVVQPIPYFRDYIQGRLYKKLIVNNSYCVTFYVNLAEASAYAIKDIGAYLDNGTIDTTHNYSLPQTMYTPQVSNTTGIITDTMSWTRIQGSFIANGTEQFITIGNFKDKANTTYARIPANSRNNGSRYTMYLIDDVSVIESDLKADAGADRHIGYGDSTYIGRPVEVGLECTWNILGDTAVIGRGAGIWVKPAVSTSYVVTQTLCGVVRKDTVQVEVWGVGMSSVNRPGTQRYSLSPNPNSGSFVLTQSISTDEAVSAELYNAMGQRMHHKILHFNKGRVTYSTDPGMAPGLYHLLLKDNSGNIRRLRFVRE